MTERPAAMSPEPNRPNGMTEWMIQLDSWVIQDGNYPDFRTGQEAEFALEFYSESGLSRYRGDRQEAKASLVGEDKYHVRGEVVALQDDAWVIDVGVMAFRDEPPPKQVQTGTLVEGRLSLGVDPFFYFENLVKRDSLPALIYAWEILEIRMQSAPFINPRGRLWVHDPSKLGWQKISSTNAWHDGGGNGLYLLRCRLLDHPPKRRSASATY